MGFRLTLSLELRKLLLSFRKAHRAGACICWDDLGVPIGNVEHRPACQGDQPPTWPHQHAMQREARAIIFVTLRRVLLARACHQ